MSKTTVTERTTESLHASLRSLKSIHITTTLVFCAIILAWVLLGYWRSNLPLFLSTLAIAVGTVTAQYASANGIRAELARRAHAVPPEATHQEDKS